MTNYDDGYDNGDNDGNEDLKVDDNAASRSVSDGHDASVQRRGLVGGAATAVQYVSMSQTIYYMVEDDGKFSA